MVYLASGKIVTTVFWKDDVTYFPWRPDGQRRLLPDGSFGDEGEIARIFSKIPEPYSFNEILDGVGDTEQQENDGIVTENDEHGSENVSSDVTKVSDSGCEQSYIWSTTPGTQNMPKSGVLTSENGSNSTSGADGENGQNDISEGNGDQIKRELQRGSRIYVSGSARAFQAANMSVRQCGARTRGKTYREFAGTTRQIIW